MTGDQARRLLALSREARWTFPSSSGNPIGKNAGEWAGRLIAEQAAFAEAARVLTGEGNADAAMEIAANVWRLWIHSRTIAAGRAFLAPILGNAAKGPSRSRALALYGDGLLAFWQGAREDSRARNEAALAAAREVGDPEALALASLGLSRVALSDRNHERARTLAVEARELARELSPAMGQAPLHMHAQALWLAGDYDGAARLFAESLELNRRLADHGMVVVELHNLGHVEVHRGNIDEAERLFTECAQSGSADDPYSKAMLEVNTACVAWGRGDAERARSLLHSAESLLAKAGIDPAAEDQTELRWLRDQLAR